MDACRVIARARASLGPDPADGDVVAALPLRESDVGNAGLDVRAAFDLLRLQAFAVEGGNRDGYLLEAFLAALSRDNDLTFRSFGILCPGRRGHRERHQRGAMDQDRFRGHLSPLPLQSGMRAGCRQLPECFRRPGVSRHFHELQFRITYAKMSAAACKQAALPAGMRLGA